MHCILNGILIVCGLSLFFPFFFFEQASCNFSGICLGHFSAQLLFHTNTFLALRNLHFVAAQQFFGLPHHFTSFVFQSLLLFICQTFMQSVPVMSVTYVLDIYMPTDCFTGLWSTSLSSFLSKDYITFPCFLSNIMGAGYISCGKDLILVLIKFSLYYYH